MSFWRRSSPPFSRAPAAQPGLPAPHRRQVKLSVLVIHRAAVVSPPPRLPSAEGAQFNVPPSLRERELESAGPQREELWQCVWSGGPAAR